ADQAMVSVTGYPLVYWIRRWEQELDKPKEPAKPSANEKEGSDQPKLKPTEVNDIARRMRLSDLLFARGHSAASASEIEVATKLVAREPSLRFRLARARLAAGDVAGAREAHGSLVDIG